MIEADTQQEFLKLYHSISRLTNTIFMLEQRTSALIDAGQNLEFRISMLEKELQRLSQRFECIERRN